MKLLASVLCVATAMVAYATGDPTPGDAATECTLVLEEGKSANETTFEAIEMCISRVDYEHMGRNPSDEKIRTTLAGACAKKPELLRCYDEVESNARGCLDETEQTRHRLYRQARLLDLEVDCGDNGADVAEIYRATFYGGNRVLKGCQENATAQTPWTDSADVNAYVLYRHKEMSKFLECLEEHKAPGEVPNWAITMANKFLDGVKCFKDGADVLCKTIVGNN